MATQGTADFEAGSGGAGTGLGFPWSKGKDPGRRRR